jgi:hypothetical protein
MGIIEKLAGGHISYRSPNVSKKTEILAIFLEKMVTGACGMLTSGTI